MIRWCEPDVVILEEASRPDVVQRVATLCGMPHWGALQGHSLGFLSRLELAHHAWRQVRFAKRRYLELELAESGMRIYGVHLSAVHSNLTELRRDYELRSLLSAVKKNRFHVLTGDFNTLAPGEQFDVWKLPARLQVILWMTGGRVRWRTIQRMLDAGYVDCYRGLQDDAGHTFPTWDPHVRLDYVFAPAEHATRVTKCQVVRDAPQVKDASDHFPLLAEVSTGQQRR